MIIKLPIILLITGEDYKNIDPKIFDSMDIVYNTTNAAVTYENLGNTLEYSDECDVTLRIPLDEFKAFKNDTLFFKNKKE